MKCYILINPTELIGIKTIGYKIVGYRLKSYYKRGERYENVHERKIWIARIN